MDYKECEESSPVLEHCKSYNNGKFGFTISDYNCAGGTYRGCEEYGNKEGGWGHWSPFGYDKLDCANYNIEDSAGSAQTEEEDSGDLAVDVWGNFSVQFYAKQGAKPDENGKYSDYIGVVDDDWLIEPDCGSTFMGVYASEDCSPSQIYKDKVLPYVENGKAIGINQIDFESGNYSTEDYPEENETTLRELLSIYQLCMDDSEDEEDGICLYHLDMDDDEVPWFEE